MRHHTAASYQVLDFSFCLVDFEASPIWADVRNSLQFALGAVMWLLVTAKFIRNSYQMYKMTKEWRFSRYLNLFAREGMLYFLAYVHLSSIPFQQITANTTHVHIPVT